MSAVPHPVWVPNDLAGWFPSGMLVGALNTPGPHAVGIATCSQCGAAVAMFTKDADEHLRRHVEWHRTLTNSGGPPPEVLL